MRKLTIQLTAGLTLLLFTAFVLQSFNFTKKAASKQSINFTTTTSAGCTVQIRGNVTYTTPPLVVSDATGAVAFFGNCGASRSGADIHFDVMTDGKLAITDIRWRVPEDPSLEILLSDPEIENEFIRYLQRILI